MSTGPKWTRRPGRDSLIRKGPPVFELLPSENEALLVRRDPFLVLDLCLDVIDRVRRLHFQRNGLPSKCLHEDLHPTAKTKDEVQRRLFLNIARQYDGQSLWRK